jgi:hypothetical protein
VDCSVAVDILDVLLVALGGEGAVLLDLLLEFLDASTDL